MSLHNFDLLTDTMLGAIGILGIAMVVSRRRRPARQMSQSPWFLVLMSVGGLLQRLPKRAGWPWSVIMGFDTAGGAVTLAAIVVLARSWKRIPSRPAECPDMTAPTSVDRS